MILLAVLVLVQVSPAPPIPADVIVTGRRVERLRRLQMRTKVDRATGTTRCIFKRRSGDPALDAAVCDATLACTPKAKTVAEMRACLAPTLDALVATGVPWQADAPKDRR